MLEPTKEPLKPISAAEKIASIGQTPPVSPEMNTCASDQFQVKKKGEEDEERQRRMREIMGCLVSFFMFKISGWCIQRHLHVKGRCWLCQIEVLLLDLLFMCGWECLWWHCSSWWPPFQSPDDPYCYTAVCSQRQWADRQILYVMLDSSDLWLRFFIFAYSGAYC